MFMYLLAPFILQNFKKIRTANPELSGCAIFGPKMAHLSWTTNLFLYKPLLLLSSTHWPFSLCKILKNSYSGSRVMKMCHFGAQNGPFAPNAFFGKFLISFSSAYLPFSLCKILKKFFQRFQSYEDAQFLDPKWPISPNDNFFSENLLISIVSFIHGYLHAKNQSQILIYY